jgi:DNA polymerase-3 subunit delta'
MSLRLEHPDLLWYFPLKRPPSRGSRERDQEALEEARLELLAQRRETPLRPSYSDDPVGLHLGTVRNLRREAARSPGMARRRVFVVADAEELVAQDSSPQAANALLKVLEEPPADAWFILTSSEPGRVLPTIRSRATSLYVGSLKPSQVKQFLLRHCDVSPEEAAKAASLSEGSIGRALGLLPADGEPGPLERIRQDAFHLLSAAVAGEPGARFAQALSYPPAGARGLQELMSFLESWLRDLAATATDAKASPLNEGADAWLTKTVEELRIDPLRAARSLGRVEEARRAAAANANPQLLLNRLLADLHHELSGTPAPTAT